MIFKEQTKIEFEKCVQTWEKNVSLARKRITLISFYNYTLYRIDLKLSSCWWTPILTKCSYKVNKLNGKIFRSMNFQAIFYRQFYFEMLTNFFLEILQTVLMLACFILCVEIYFYLTIRAREYAQEAINCASSMFHSTIFFVNRFGISRNRLCMRHDLPN